MRNILIFISIVTSFGLKIQDDRHNLSVATHALSRLNEVHDQQIMNHEIAKGSRIIDFKYKLGSDPNQYRPEHRPSPRIMNYLPLTDNKEQIAPINRDIQVVKRQYLKSVAYNKTVDMAKARKLAQDFSTGEGLSVLTYFEGLTEHGLNYYKLRPDHYRLWLAIKILANQDVRMYANSIAEDISLFQDFYLKAREKKIVQRTGIPVPTPELLKRFQESQASNKRESSLLSNVTQVNKKELSLPKNTSPTAVPLPKSSILAEQKQKLLQSKPTPPKRLPQFQNPPNQTTPQNISRLLAKQNQNQNVSKNSKIS